MYVCVLVCHQVKEVREFVFKHFGTLLYQWPKKPAAAKKLDIAPCAERDSDQNYGLTEIYLRFASQTLSPVSSCAHTTQVLQQENRVRAAAQGLLAAGGGRPRQRWHPRAALRHPEAWDRVEAGSRVAVWCGVQ